MVAPSLTTVKPAMKETPKTHANVKLNHARLITHKKLTNQRAWN